MPSLQRIGGILLTMFIGANAFINVAPFNSSAELYGTAGGIGVVVLGISYWIWTHDREQSTQQPAN